MGSDDTKRVVVRMIVEYEVAVPLTDLRALLDLAEAFAELRKIVQAGNSWWWMDGECVGCVKYGYDQEHDGDCAAMALDRALDALGGE